MLQSMKYENQKRLVLVAFLFIPLMLLAAFSFYPACYLLYLSFTDWDGTALIKHYAGIANYKHIFDDPTITRVFAHYIPYAVVSLVTAAFSLYLAVVLNKKLIGKNLFKSIIFLPYIINSVATSFMFGYLLRNEEGAINILLHKVGLGFLAANWLGNPDMINYVLAFIGSWKYAGLFMVIFLGALQSIPREIYDAANIDGASGWQAFRYITLPGIDTVIELALFLIIAGTLNTFEFPYILTHGGPMGSSETFVTKTVDVAFRFNDFGTASAMGILLMVSIIVIVSIQRKFLNKQRGLSDEN